MRRFFIIAFAVYASTACSSSNKSVSERDDIGTERAEILSESGMIKRTLPLRDFKEIECGCVVTFNYTQSSDYSVTLTTTEQGHDLIEVYVEDGTLYVRGKAVKDNEERGRKTPEIILDVCSPNPRRIECTGVVKAKLSDIDTDDFTLVAGGVSNVNVGRIKGRAVKIYKGGAAKLKTGAVGASGGLDIKSSGTGNIVSGDINCQSIKIDKSGAAGVMSGKIVSRSTFGISCTGAGVLSMADMEARDVQMTIGGAAEVKGGKIVGTTLKINQSGVGKSEITFKGRQVEISSSGARKMKIGVECDKLHVIHSGVSAMTITGTADDVKIEGSGAASVNCSGLNSF